MSRPESRPDPIGGSEPVSGTRDSGMGLFFFLKANRHLWVWPTSYNIIKILYTYNCVPFTNTKLNFYIYNQSADLHVVNPSKYVGQLYADVC